ncbi:hypothetical protein [Candidatus Arsenophonus triatominarum]|uniref:hypothetical protein n=1 Tax=Candidatus Arsenophonus triatominarum TaxID=57911 RepID=UPI0007C57A21
MATWENYRFRQGTASNGMIAQIQNMLSSMFKKSTTDAALTDKERALIGSSTRVQILRYVIDSASLSLDVKCVLPTPLGPSNTTFLLRSIPVFVA